MRITPMAFGMVVWSCLTLGGCTWVKLTEEGKSVRVISLDEAQRCIKKGELTTSVRDEVGPLERNRQKVLDEVESLARNDARSIGANAIAPVSDLVNGERRFAAYDCM
jgi:hypothetical protein